MTDVERLFRTYNAALVRYLTRRLGDRDWAEEVAQETFVRALRQTSIQNERAWLFAVATNLVRDEARKDMRRRKHLALLAEQERDEMIEPEEEVQATAAEQQNNKPEKEAKAEDGEQLTEALAVALEARGHQALAIATTADEGVAALVGGLADRVTPTGAVHRRQDPSGLRASRYVRVVFGHDARSSGDARCVQGRCGR